MKKGSIVSTLLVLGVVTFAASHGPSLLDEQQVWMDSLELAGTTLLLVGSCIIVSGTGRRELTSILFYTAGGCLVFARLLDLTEDFDVLDQVAIIGNHGMGHGLAIKAMQTVGFLLMLLALLAILREVDRLRGVAETERKRYKDLHEASLFLVRVADMSADAVVGCDREGIVRTWNLGAQGLFQCKPEAAVGRHLREFVDELDSLGDSPLDWVGIERALTDVEVTAVSSSGGRLAASASFSPVCDDSGEIVGASVIIRDIVARKRAEHELLSSRNLLAGALHNAEVGMFIVGKNLNMIEVNARMEEITGAKGSDFATIEDGARALSDTPELIVNAVNERVLAKGVPVEFRNVTINRPDGKKRICNGGVSPVFDDEGAVVGAVCIVVDVTEREQLQARLLESQKMESLGRLAGGIAHDFNNILGGILGYASLLRDKAEPDSVFHRYSMAIENSAARASELTHQLLAFARGKKTQVQPVDLNDIAEEILRLLSLGVDPNIHVALAKCAGLYTIEADPSQIRQVLINLLINARDALGPQGRIDVTTANIDMDEPLRRRLNLDQAGPYVRVTVVDNGCGMTQEICRRIFEPFFTTKGKTKGYGLGLSVVYGIVESHKGSIAVDSQPGSGTRIDVYFPASGVAGAKSAQPSSQQETRPSQDTETILVVDDEQLIQMLVRDVLEQEGYHVISAESGEQAVEVFEKHPDGIALVVMDLLMPGMGGSKALEALRKVDPSLRCIISSGYGDETIDPVFVGDEHVSFVGKPYQAQALVRSVRELLDK